MLRDVFYYGNKPNVHPREQFAKDLKDARKKAKTPDFWIINEFCDYTNFDWDFDFEFLPDDEVWTQDHNNIWPSTHQQDSGTWLCPKKHSDMNIYRNDVDPLKRKNIKSDCWVALDLIDESRWDFTWHPDPSSPPYIYKWGSKFAPVEFQCVLEYRTPGATQIKYMSNIVELLPQTDRWVEVQAIDKSKFDLSWRPDPMDPPLIYIWGNKYIDPELKSTLEYHTPGATVKKYMTQRLDVLPETDRWVEVQAIDKSKFDLSWRPDPREPAYIYTWGNKWVDAELEPTLEYRCPDATDRKYMPEKVAVLPQWNKWKEIVPVDKNRSIQSGFDFSWRPDPREPAYIYTWGNPWVEAEFEPTLEYHCENATERKYMDNTVHVQPQYDRWFVIEDIIQDSFDFSWRPDPREPALIYVFGNDQYDAVHMPTIEYHMPGATERKYVFDENLRAKLKPSPNRFEHLEDSYLEDYSWTPDPKSPPYIYAFGNQWNKPEDKISIQYVVQGATEYKYMDVRAIRRPCMDKWQIPENVDTTGFDFSWEPSPKEPAYIYEFGTQHQKTGGPRYVVEGATEIKYVSTQKVRALPDSKANWTIPPHVDVTEFDFSWHPDNTSPAYIYHFATQWALTGGPIYTVEGATERKYLETPSAKALPNKENWVVPLDVDADSFDFSWHPYVEDQPYIYQFGTQWQKTGGPKFIAPGANSTSPTKYIDTRILKAKRLPNKDRFTVLDDLNIESFDYSWHPDETEEPYIYVFGNTQHPAEEMPTIEYRVSGATQIKYVKDIVAKLGPSKKNWIIPDNVDVSEFDFSWIPNPKDPAYIYEFGTQHQKTGGPRYVVPGATEVKYVSTQIAKALPTKDNWIIPSHVDITGFDFSWHPDNTSPAYIYQFGTQWALTGGPKYVVEDATEVKYIDTQIAKALPNRENWVVPADVDVDSFDFSWHPYVEDQPYIYVFGTQHQKTGGPKYMTPGVTTASPVKYIDTRILKAKRLPNKDRFTILDDLNIAEFDWSWHPDDTDEPYIYQFGNTQHPAEEMPTIEYKVNGATQIKYVKDIVAKIGASKKNWIIPANIDDSGFDYSWVPNPKDNAYIYEFGTQHQKNGGPKYVVRGATEVKYVSTQVAKAIPDMTKWIIPDHVDITGFDFSWHPDNTSPAYVYQFGTQWALTGGPKYVVDDATEIKYIDTQVAKALPNKENWVVPADVDSESFDFSWHPYVEDQPYIYVFGTQHQKTGGPKYMTPGVTTASPVKYIDVRILRSKRLPNKSRFTVLGNYKIKEFDWSWHPDDTEQPYIYQFGNTQHPAEEMPTIEYKVPGATQIKYVSNVVAVLDQNLTNWEVPNNVDTTGFDFSWVPNPKDPAYIYQFGTQWQKTGGPRYVVEGATEIKYVSTYKVKALPNKDDPRWQIPDHVDITGFDFSWHPDDTDPAYIYQFGTQWALTGGPKFVMPDAKEVKYIDNPVAKALPNKENWVIPLDVDVDSFDFSWHPYVEDQPYIYVFGTQHQKTGGPRYITPGATGKSPVKYIDTRILKAKRLPNKERFTILDNLKIKDFDYSWHPDERDDPYVYVFGNQHYNGQIMPTVEYRVAGAKSVKYVDDIVAILDQDMTNWEVPNNIDITSFDFSWKPNPRDPEYIYEFATQWNNRGGPKYMVPHASDYKYVENVKAKTKPSKKNWVIPEGISVDSFDFSWVPHPEAPPYIYQFGTQWQKTGGPKYVVEGATDVKYVSDIKAKALPNKSRFKVLHNIENSSFDYSWHPDATDEPYIYVFGNQWFSAEKMPTIMYRVVNATEHKYINDVVPKLKQSKKNWKIPKGINVKDFDFSWVPDPGSPPYIYQFGTLQDDMDGPRYETPGHNGEIVKLERVYRIIEEVEEVEEETIIEVNRYYIETTLEDLVNQHPDEVFWALRPNINYENFDFNWRPKMEQAKYVQVFGSPDSEITQTYFLSAKMYLQGNKDLNFVTNNKLSEEYLASLFKQPDMFLVDRGNSETNDRFNALKQRFPNIQKTRFLNSWVDTIKRCINRSNTELCWILNSELDYSKFNFNFYPNPWQTKHVHVFGTQWTHWGTTYMVNRETFAEDTKYIPVIEHLDKKLNFVKDKKAIATNNLYDMILIDHDNPQLVDVESLLKYKANGKSVKVVKYEKSYLETLRKIVNDLPEKKDHYMWICSSVCDYTAFDFSYICDPFAKDNLHVFSTDKQKFGDTFLIDINRTREIINDIQELQDYKKVNYSQSLRVSRLPAPVIMTHHDTHVEAVRSAKFNFPYAIFATEKLDVVDTEPLSLWDSESKNILITSTGASRIIVPKEAKENLKDQLYDYPYIKTSSKLALSKPLDIVFLSNGEKCADENYKYLLEVTKGIKNRIVRVDGINGRVEAYHAASHASNTPWAFTVFAKLKINPKFDFNWQPDRLQMPKHYIFHAKNPVNGLEYGHQGMIAYNKKLVLNNWGEGLDFTLDSPHETVELLSGTATFNTDEFSTWRTAFREVIKLKSDYEQVSQERLEVWLTRAKGNFAEHCLQGAKDAVQFYDDVSGDIDQLRQSYEWDWLLEYYNRKYK